MDIFTWLPAITVDGVVVAAAKLASDSALASSPLTRGTEGAAPQLPLLALPHNRKQWFMQRERGVQYGAGQCVSCYIGGQSSHFMAILVM